MHLIMDGYNPKYAHQHNGSFYEYQKVDKANVLELSDSCKGRCQYLFVTCKYNIHMQQLLANYYHDLVLFGTGLIIMLLL